MSSAVQADYVLCPADRFWFRPAYTAGKCPLCGEVAPAEPPPLPPLLRIDRFSLAMATVGLLSVGMSILVLVMYFSG